MSILSLDEKEALDARFQKFMSRLLMVAKYAPMEKYLYPIMQGVPFRDMEVAIDMAMIEKSKANDNDHA